MNINTQEAKYLIMLVIKNNPLGVMYYTLDKLFIIKMPDMIISVHGNKLLSLLDEMVKDGIIQDRAQGYIKGPNFPDDF